MHFLTILICYYYLRITLCTLLQVSNNNEVEEFCNSETFRPVCSQNEVIIIEHAMFGRRILGRCLDKERKEMKDLNIGDKKAVGCYSDVKQIIDPLCSLKQSCEVRVAELNANVPCYTFLRYFLEVQYSCIRVVQEKQDCAMELNFDKQHISSQKVSTNGCGTSTRPWIVNSLAGQKINISLSYISSNSGNESESYYFSDKSTRGREQCNGGYIQDSNARKQILICHGKERKNIIDKKSFMSESNNIEVVISDVKLDSTFLLALEATGCSDLIPPADAWLKRTENEATIGCYSTRLRWQLKCIGQRWIGVIGNCSQGKNIILRNGVTIERKDSSKDNQMIVIFGIVIFGVVLCMLITCLGIVFLKRYYAIRKSNPLKLNPGSFKLDTNTSVYHNGTLAQQNNSTIEPSNLIYAQNSNYKSNVIASQDSAQYYELDQSLLKIDSN